jgi:hypothetical protein
VGKLRSSRFSEQASHGNKQRTEPPVGRNDRPFLQQNKQWNTFVQASKDSLSYSGGEIDVKGLLPVGYLNITSQALSLDDADHHLITLRDVTAQKEAERSNFAAEKAIAMSKAKTDMMQMVSHELRSPLQGIMGMTFSFGGNGSSGATTGFKFGSTPAPAGESAPASSFKFGEQPSSAANETKTIVPPLGSVPSDGASNDDRSKRRRGGRDDGDSSRVPSFGGNTSSAPASTPAFSFGGSAPAAAAPTTFGSH